ncbi:MAG TPA: hypothetical protein VK973_13955 [Arenicellales bacterium]|nr:hypothetical protein [Arenicellales bacterium]
MEALKTDIAVNETLDVVVAARRLVARCQCAMRDDEVTMEEAKDIFHEAMQVAQEAAEALTAAQQANSADRVFDTIRRGEGFDYSRYQCGVLEDANLQPIRAGMNVRELYPERDSAA